MYPEMAEKAEKPKMSQSENSAQQYGLVNKETGDVRTSNDYGNATLVNGEGGKNELNFTDWKPWAYTAGGGALAYLLAKKLFDDDDEEDGKKKGFLGTILPYLAAVGGGLGGYALSGVGNEAGQNGEVAFKIGPDGKVQMPDKPSSAGKFLKWPGYGLAGASVGATGTKMWLNYLGSAPDRLYDAAKREVGLGPSTTPARLKNLVQNVENDYPFMGFKDGRRISIDKNRPEFSIFKDRINKALAIESRRNGRWRWLEGLRRGIVGRGKYVKPGIWGLLATALGAVSGHIGDSMNEKYQAYLNVMKALGKDVND